MNCAMLLAGLSFATMRRPFRNYHVLADFWQLDWPFLRQLIVIGTQISIAPLTAVQSFVGCGAPVALSAPVHSRLIRSRFRLP